MMAQHALPSHKPFPWLETILAAAILGSIAYSAWHVVSFGYLPSPFFYEPMDTFADWFNTAFWARQEGAYDTWGTIYPPLSFVALRLFTLDYCYPPVRMFEGSPGYDPRGCDWLGLAMMGVFFVVNVILTYLTFRKIEPRTAVVRTICVAAGMPMLSVLERGNLLLMTYTCVILAFGPLVASARLRWVFAALAINFKVYLVGAVAAMLLKRRWLWAEGALIATVLLYFGTLAIFGDGTPQQIVTNIRSFTENRAAGILDGWSAFTYIPFVSVLELGTFPMSGVIGSKPVNILEVVLPALRWLTLGLILLAALAIWWRPDLYSPSRAVLLGIATALSTSESGIYTLIFIFLFVMMEPWRGFGRKWAIVACYVLAIPLDYNIDTLPEGITALYFTGAEGFITRHIVLGPFLRPLIIMTVIWAIALTTICDAWDAGLVRRPAETRSGEKQPAGPSSRPEPV
jgi:hypothetical protein